MRIYVAGPSGWRTTDEATKAPPKKKAAAAEMTIKNSQLSRVARLLNEFLMLQLGAKTTDESPGEEEKKEAARGANVKVLGRWDNVVD
jgi:hypothetical protein